MTAGRKLFDGKDEKSVIQKLKDAWLVNANDEEACQEAGISPQALYAYQVSRPLFLEQKKLWKQKTKFRAKVNVSKKVEEGDVPTSQWYLERQGKDEGYSNRTELTGKDGSALFDLVGLLDKADGQERGANKAVPAESDIVCREDVGVDSTEE